MNFAPDGGSSERDCDYENGGGERRHPVCARVPIEKTQCQGENKADYHEQHFVDDRFADGEGVEAPAKHGDAEKEPSAELEGPEERRFLEGTRDEKTSYGPIVILDFGRFWGVDGPRTGEQPRGRL